MLYCTIRMTYLGEHKPGRIKPGRIKRAALSLQHQNYYMFCFLIRPRLYASEARGTLLIIITNILIILIHYYHYYYYYYYYHYFCFLIRPRLYASELYYIVSYDIIGDQCSRGRYSIIICISIIHFILLLYYLSLTY